MKKVIINYIFDKIGYIFILILNSVLIIGFYKLMGEKAEVIYPFSITLFLTICFIIYDFFRYLMFNRDIHRALNEENHKIRCFTREQREISKLITELNIKHVNNKNDIENNYKEKIHFLANGIHKFKNYISVISLIIDKAKKEEVFNSSTLIEIEEENSNLESSLQQVLSFIKMDNFENDLEIVKLDIVEEVKSIININKSRFINSEVFPVFKFQKQVFIHTDRKWNRILIEQVVTNAVKYTIKGLNRKVHFYVEEHEEKVILKIIDNGEGIPKYDLNRIYDAFFTGENGREIRNSTGIGLFIGKKICKRLKHNIEIVSEKGVGTEVRITYLKKM